MLAPARDDDSAASDPVPRHDEASRKAAPGMSERLHRALQQGGVPQLLRRSLNRLASPWLEFGSVTFFRRWLDRGPEVPRPRPGLSVYQASLDDVAMVLEASDPRRTKEIVQERLGRGDLCFLALDDDDRPIHSGWATLVGAHVPRSEEHTSELQSRGHLVCRLLLEKKK